MKERGLIESAQVREIPRELWGDLIGEATPCAFGLNARSRADRLRALGWVPKEKGMWDSWWDDELPALLRHEGKA